MAVLWRVVYQCCSTECDKFTASIGACNAYFHRVMSGQSYFGVGGTLQRAAGCDALIL